MPRRRPERVTPELLEYGFDACPSDELSACGPYEFLASSSLIRSAVERFRAGETDQSAKAVVLLFPINILWALFGGPWPQPYLGIPAPVRRRNILSPRRPIDLARFVRPQTHLGDPERIIKYYVHPGLSLPKLKKALGELLLSDHPELLKKTTEVRWHREKRGRGSLIEQDKSLLKSLSAWRLTRQFGYTAQAAIDLMRQSGLNTYQEERAFRRAVKRAAQQIKALERQLLKFAKRVTA